VSKRNSDFLLPLLYPSTCLYYIIPPFPLLFSLWDHTLIHPRSLSFAFQNVAFSVFSVSMVLFLPLTPPSFVGPPNIIIIIFRLLSFWDIFLFFFLELHMCGWIVLSQFSSLISHINHCHSFLRISSLCSYQLVQCFIYHVGLFRELFFFALMGC